MPQPAQRLVLAGLVLGALLAPASAAEREDVRKAINLVTSVKIPFPENLSRNRAKTERVWLDREGATTGCTTSLSVGSTLMRYTITLLITSWTASSMSVRLPASRRLSVSSERS